MDSWQLDTPSGPPLLGDVLPLDRSLSIFSSLTRSVESIQTRLNDAGVNTTVLAPGNEAISRLPRKPWEDPEDGEGGDKGDKGKYSGMGGEDRAGRNLRRFVEMHCVGVSPWEKGVKVRTVGGGEVWWDEDAEGRKIYPDGIKVKRVQGEVENGALWVLEGVVNYAEKE
ncbi:hypothetical protein EX30DRAFT_304239 [Ascodesmis nigricans]|uniref:FAS1 domain-containing protein n=1 Tax=Ascodesmis nigricans TaxID=341454 RepID=A0A4S2N1A0_9PEZI|nr:hypothetical protein EX30DRAFT_304239 [Ascodesmis nigricans]